MDSAQDRKEQQGVPVRAKGGGLLRCRQGRVGAGLRGWALSEGLWRHRKRAFLRWRDKGKRPKSKEMVGDYGVVLLFSVERGVSKGVAGGQVWKVKARSAGPQAWQGEHGSQSDGEGPRWPRRDEMRIVKRRGTPQGRKGGCEVA